ncbi:hypothetical protein HF086_006931 [Spodoptera exigua]|uniref:Uncharacterized protein n=1 Tax=Spodoptera exigua TaxID=7107 RepID=A0A922MHX7_SPOEX|nr:hypothetical protein HF086_006931 [Spodoptera exigua]
MGRLAPLVIRLATVSLVAFVLAEPGNGGDQSVARVDRDTALPAPGTAPPPPRRAGKRERNRKRTTTTTTTTVDPDSNDVGNVPTTVTTTTTADPRALDHISNLLLGLKRQRATAPAPPGPQRRWPGKQHKRRRRRTTTTTTTTESDETEPTTTLQTTTIDPRSIDHSKCLSTAAKNKIRSSGSHAFDY